MLENNSVSVVDLLCCKFRSCCSDCSIFSTDEVRYKVCVDFINGLLITFFWRETFFRSLQHEVPRFSRGTGSTAVGAMDCGKMFIILIFCSTFKSNIMII